MGAKIWTRTSCSTTFWTFGAFSQSKSNQKNLKKFCARWNRCLRDEGNFTFQWRTLDPREGLQKSRNFFIRIFIYLYFSLNQVLGRNKLISVEISIFISPFSCQKNLSKQEFPPGFLKYSAISIATFERLANRWKNRTDRFNFLNPPKRDF